MSSRPVLEDCYARHVSIRGKSDPASLRCACMLGHIYAILFDDARAVALLNESVSNACAAYGHTSVIACQCKYHLGMAFFIQKNVNSAMDCLAPLTDTSMIPGIVVSIVFWIVILSHLSHLLLQQIVRQLVLALAPSRTRQKLPHLIASLTSAGCPKQ